MTQLVTERPEPRAARDFSFPDVASADQPGVRVRAVHVPGRPKARLLVSADAGAAAEPIEAPGVANLLAESMTRGAAGLGERQLAIAFERLGTSPTTGVSFDQAQASLSVPVGFLPEAGALLAEVVRRPTLDPGDVEDTRQALIDDDRASMTQPGAVVSRVVRRVVWAPGCRYAEAATGTAESLAEVGTDQVAAFHADRWRDQALVLVIVGDLSTVDVDAVAKPFAAEVDLDRSIIAPLPGTTDRTVVLADRPGAAQSVLLLSRPGPALGEPDAAALDVALAAAFGAFGSRLNLRMREELGYTYGARGGVTRRRDGGVFTASMSVRTEVTADAVREAVGVIDRVLDEGLDDDEVGRARDNLARRYPVQFDDNRSIASAVSELLVNGLPDDFHDQRLAALRDVTADEANAALRRVVTTDDLVIGVAGDGDAVEKDLIDLDVGELVRRDP